MTQRKILVTAALPYTNGPIHLGHLVEYIQTDIWARFQRLVGNRCVYVCADDTHGTATMIRARALGRSEEDLIREMQAEHERDFAAFDVRFDHFGSTHSPANQALCNRIWAAIRSAGLVTTRDVQQLYDVEQGTFLADRFVRGTCPNCKSPNQPGDNCSMCGATYAPGDLIDPKSTLSGSVPELRSAPHLFIELEQLHDFLEQWTQQGNHVSREIANYLKGHFLGGVSEPGGRKVLRPWDISRPAPYFGFEIPDSPGNYWYVWFDAPIGYIAATAEWCQKHGEALSDWWESADSEIHHFIGKDIVYFHTLFWPGMLKVAGFTLPTQVHVHGFLTVNGQKMSKSTGTFIKAETYLQHLDPSALRYFYASKLTPRVDDLDLNFEEFVNKFNADVVGKVVNLASRTAKFVERRGLSATYPDDGGLFQRFAEAGAAIGEAYDACDYARAMKLIMELADQANAYVDQRRPWELKNDPDRAAELQDVATVVLNLFRQLVIYLAPVLPKLAEKVGALLKDPLVDWRQAARPLLGQSISKFEHLSKRIDMSDIESMLETTKAEFAADAGNATPAFNDSGDALAKEPLADECTIDDFSKVDLRVARVIAADHVEGANKLLKLTVSLGGEHQRRVFAGIKAAYQPQQLVGRLVVVVANLKPRQMKFGLSEGMVCAAGEGGKDVFLLSPDSGAVPGQRVH